MSSQQLLLHIKNFGLPNLLHQGFKREGEKKHHYLSPHLCNRANFNRGNVILEQLTSFRVTQEQLPSLPHPSALHSLVVSCPLGASWVSLPCCAQPNFSPLVRVKFCHLWDFNHYCLQCQLFSKETNTVYKGENEEEHPAFDFIDIHECKQLQGPLLGENVICLLFSIHTISDCLNILNWVGFSRTEK